jgi:hypothetical protein
LVLRYSSRSGVWRGGLAASLGYHKWVPFPTPNSIAFSLSDAVVLAVPPGPILAVAVSHRKRWRRAEMFLCSENRGDRPAPWSLQQQRFRMRFLTEWFSFRWRNRLDRALVLSLVC